MQHQKKKIIFWGTPNFAAFILEKLISQGYCPQALITTSDKPVGKEKFLNSPATKKIAQKYNLPVWQFDNLKNESVLKTLVDLKPDIFIIAAYGLIIPQEILKIPVQGCLNVHPSLLPRYRGASPIQAAILNNDKKTGTTIMLMDEKVDHGPIISQKKLKIKPGETTPSLTKKLALLSADLLIKILPLWLENKIKTRPQKHKKATFTRQIKKIHGQIFWYKPAQQIIQMWRAYQPWPGIYTFFKGKMLKIIDLEILKIKHSFVPGQVFLTPDKNLAVACSKNAIILKKVHLEGKNPVKGIDFFNGHREIIKQIL